MANEITLTASLSGYKASTMSQAESKSVTGATFNMSGTPYMKGSLLVLTSATLIPMGSVTAPHWAWFRNADLTNFIKIRNGASGADVAKFLAGEQSPIPLFDTGTYYAIADTASCYLEYLIFSL